MATPQKPGGNDLFGGGSNPQLMRGALLLVAAVLLGAFLLAKGFDSSPAAEVTVGSDDTQTTLDDEGGEPTVATTAPDTETTLREAKAPAEVTVLVVNGADIPGTATQFSDKLKAEGYNMAEPGTAEPAVNATSTVYYNPDSQPEALAIASALGIPAESVKPMPNPVPTADASLREATVLVVIGTDLAS